MDSVPCDFIFEWLFEIESVPDVRGNARVKSQRDPTAAYHGTTLTNNRHLYL
jgi:hypothetical protein